MKKSMLRLVLVIIVSLALAFPVVAQAATYEFTWMYVQHRSYASGNERSQVAFGILNSDTDADLLDEAMILGIVLKDPNGMAVALTARSNQPYIYLGGHYDGWTNNWTYREPYTSADFAYTITEELIPGTYQLEVQMEGQTLTRSYDFVARTVMPIVNSDSFEISKDDSGNLLWTWDSPMYQNLSDQPTNAKAHFSFFNQGNFAGLGHITVPTNMGYLFVPADVVAYAESQGDEFHFTIEVRQHNGNNRGYSNTVTVYGSLDGGSYAPVGTTADNTPDFTWQHDNTSTWYRLYLEDGSGTRIYREWYETSDICSDGKCSVSPEALGELAGGDYKWWIKSWASKENTSWNDGTSFTLIE